jgi:phosphoribosylformylglycinamidine synthase PurS subunit
VKAVVTVMPKQDVLDPQGQAIQRAAGALGHAGIREVRQGKRFELTLDVQDRAGAESLLAEVAEKLLANPVIEDFRVESIEA